MATLFEKRRHMPVIIPVSIVWNIAIVIACLVAARDIYNLKEFYNLGDPVQLFVTFLALIPVALAIYSSIEIFRHKPGGRFAALAIYYVGLILSIAYLLHLWGVFIGIDAFSKALLDNSVWVLGIAIAYGFYWAIGRFVSDENPNRELMEMVVIGIAMLFLIFLLWFSDMLGAINHILDTYGHHRTWEVTALVGIFGYLSYRMLHLGDYFDETTGQREAWQGWLMLSPNIIGFALFFAGPLLLSFYLSFTDSKVGQIPQFNGLSNYIEILSLEFKTRDADAAGNAQAELSYGYSELETLRFGNTDVIIGAKDTLFWQSLRNTIWFCMMLVVFSTIPALFLAMILNSKIPGMNFFRALYFLPSVAAVVGTALIWRWLYDPTIGYFNYFIGEGVDFLNRIGMDIGDKNVNWLTDQGVVLFSIVLLAAWQVTGFNTVLFLAGLQGIPKTLYEAAYVDGANRYQRFRHVTLPMLAPTTFFVIITTIITGLQVFNEPYALISSRPMPAAATTSVYYLYNRGFNRFEFGYASSVAWLLFALIFIVTLAQFRLSKSGAYD